MSKNIIIIVVCLLLVAGLGVGVFWYFNQNRQPSTNISTGTNVNINGVLNTNQVNATVNYIPSEEEKKMCAQTNDEKNCLKAGYYMWTRSQDVKNLNEAINRGDYNQCDKLTRRTEDVEICKRDITAKINEISYCDTVANKAECQFFVNVKKNTWSACQEIKDANYQDRCFKQYITNNRELEDGVCDVGSDADNKQCQDILYYLDAVSAGDYSLCRKISTAQGIKNCLSRLPPDKDSDGLSDYLEDNYYLTDPNIKDSDGDGLTDGDEAYIYKTDPTRKDTDGDGFDDGTEVKAGYNPLQR